MKYFAILVLSLVSVALFAQDAKQVDTQYVQSKAAPYESIILQGNLTHQLDWDEFILTDGAGSVKLELDGPAEYEMNQNLLGANVRVYGVVEKDHQWDNAEVKALKIRVVGQAPQPAVNQNAAVPANQNAAAPVNQNAAVPANQNAVASVNQNAAVPANQNTGSVSGEVNMNGRDDLAEAFENAYGWGLSDDFFD